MVNTNYSVQILDYRNGAANATLLANTDAGRVAEDRLQSIEDLQTLLDQAGIAATTARTITTSDVTRARALRTQLRQVLSATELTTAIAQLNALLVAAHPDATLNWVSDTHEWGWHLSVPADTDAVRQLQLVTTSSLLAMTRTFGLARFGDCTATDCTGMFADTSRGGRRRFCDPTRCGNRAHVAAYRARNSHTHTGSSEPKNH